jgi:hypothetical protein
MTPDITGLEHSIITQHDGSPYIDRYHIVDTPSYHARFHHWHSSDDKRAPHDHPWPNTTIVLAGHLLEHTRDGARDLTPGTTVTRPAVMPHRIELVSDDAWTLFVTGPVERRWGFYTDTGWVYWRDWPWR